LQEKKNGTKQASFRMTTVSMVMFEKSTGAAAGEWVWKFPATKPKENSTGSAAGRFALQRCKDCQIPTVSNENVLSEKENPGQSSSVCVSWPKRLEDCRQTVDTAHTMSANVHVWMLKSDRHLASGRALDLEITSCSKL
jgi:hypothetical protein